MALINIDNAETVRLAWRDEATAVRRQENDDALIASTSPNSTSINDNGFLLHKVSNLDTLAGLAIKYNVPVSDLKRFNGILSDTDLYSREVMFVPTKLVPVSEDVQLIFTQIVSGIGRHPILKADLPSHSTMPLSTSGIMDGVDNEAGTVPSIPWWCQCGTCSVEDEALSCGQRAHGLNPSCRQVELMEYKLEDRLQSGAEASGRNIFGDLVRRRRRGSRSTSEDGFTLENTSGQGQNSFPDDQQYSWKENGAAASASATAFFCNLGRAIGESRTAFVQTIKKAASQPALAGSQSRSIKETTDSMLTSLRQGLLPRGILRPEWPFARPPTTPQVTHACNALSMLNTRSKEVAKCD
jgi:LysM repeat protein